jgi:hypothetical protein
MTKNEAEEARLIVDTTLNALLAWTPTQGRSGSELRTAVGDVKANSYAYLLDDTIGPPLVTCFDLAVETGITLPQILQVRSVTWAAAEPRSSGAIIVQDSLVELCLMAAAQVIAAMMFKSREQVEQVKTAINTVFVEIAEELADQMDAMTYRAVITLHAAVTAHLVETVRPLPKMIRYRFAVPNPTVLIAHKLYADASRADEMRDENNIVHPAFAPRTGRALAR